MATLAENLALDEALLDEALLDEAILDEAEAAGRPTETLRFWEPDEIGVVIGRSSKIEVETRPDACRAANLPVLRRPSGGAAIVTGPGCLMYALVLSIERRPVLRNVDRAHRFVLATLADALKPLVPEVTCRGISDLAMLDRKFSGNSVRRKRSHLLYHGTLLYDFPLELIPRYLATPPRQPDYRAGREHATFVANLPLDAQAIRRALIAAWDAKDPRTDWPAEQTARLVTEKYGLAEWNEAGKCGA